MSSARMQRARSINQLGLSECNNATTTIRGSADAAPLSACKTFTGTIAVATDSEAVIELEGIEKIEGDFIAANNPEATTFGSSTLVEATGLVEFSNLGVLANISLPSWESAGSLILDRIPSPTYTDFQQKGQQISEVYVRNTTFAFFSGLTLVGAQIDVLEIVDNEYLQLINFMAGNITKSCTITGNSGELTLQLPNLTYAYSLDINNASEITLPMLSSVSNGMQLSYSEASELSLPELTYVGGDLVISNNGQLDTLELDGLVNVQGNVQITGNDELGVIEGLPYLSSIGGNLELMGALNHIDLPALGIVRKNVNIQSTSSLNCSDVPSSVAKGSYSCNGNADTVDDTTSADKKNGLSAGAKAGIALGAIASAALIAGLTTFHIWRRRKRSQHNNASHSEAEKAPPYNPGTLASERKDNLELDEYDVQPHYYNASSQKNLIHQRSEEMGRPTSSGRPGPEGRHEMGNTKDPPAAYELDAEGEVGKGMGLD